MSINNMVKQKISTFKEGHVFSLEDFRHFKNDNAVSLSLSRLLKEGRINRISKGLYLKPKIQQNDYVLPPSSDEIISSLNDGHVSGVAAFKSLGLTDDVPTEIIIVGKRFSRHVQVAEIKIRYRRKSKILKTRHKELLQILDALKEIKNIPGTTVEKSIIRLKEIILNLNVDKRLKLVSLGLRYPPLARALLGAFLEEADPQASGALKASLNPTTNYKLGDFGDVLPNQKSWRII